MLKKLLGIAATTVTVLVKVFLLSVLFVVFFAAVSSYGFVMVPLAVLFALVVYVVMEFRAEPQKPQSVTVEVPQQDVNLETNLSR